MTAGIAIILGLGSAFALALFCLSFAYPSGRFITLWSEIPQAERVRYRLLRFDATPGLARYRWLMILVYFAVKWINGEQAKHILPPVFRHNVMGIELCLVVMYVTIIIAYGLCWSWRVLRGFAGERGPQIQKIAGGVLVLSALGLSAWAYLLNRVFLHGSYHWR